MTATTLYVAAHEHDNQATVKGISKDSKDAATAQAILAEIAAGEHPSNCTFHSFQTRAYSVPAELESIAESFTSVAEFTQAETGLLGGFIIIEGQGSQAVMGIGLTAAECEESARQWIVADLKDSGMPIDDVDAHLSDASSPVWVTEALLNFCSENQANLAAADICFANEVQRQSSGIWGLEGEHAAKACDGAVDELLSRYQQKQEATKKVFAVTCEVSGELGNSFLRVERVAPSLASARKYLSERRDSINAQGAMTARTPILQPDNLSVSYPDGRQYAWYDIKESSISE